MSLWAYIEGMLACVPCAHACKPICIDKVIEIWPMGSLKNMHEPFLRDIIRCLDILKFFCEEPQDSLMIHLPFPYDLLNKLYEPYFYKTRLNNSYPVYIFCEPNSHWVSILCTLIIFYKLHWTTLCPPNCTYQCSLHYQLSFQRLSGSLMMVCSLWF